MKREYLLCILFLFLSIISCDDNLSFNSEPAFIITSEDNGKTFQTSVGSMFQAVFNECGGCADIWEIDEMDSNIISLQQTYTQNHSCTNCEGGAHEVVFEFTGKSNGQSVLVFSYFDETISVTIQVE